MRALREGILRGIYPLGAQVPAPDQASTQAQVQLLGAGAILGEVIAAQQILKGDWQIDAAVWSVTSFTELQRDGMAAERLARLGETSAAPYVRRRSMHRKVRSSPRPTMYAPCRN